MDSLLSLFSFIGYISIAGIVVISFQQLFSSKKRNNSKTQIQNLNAKLAMLRMSLKSRVKKKSNQYRVTFKCPIATGDPIDAALTQLTTISFETGDDMQKYFDLSRKINSLLVTDAAADASKNNTDAAPAATGHEDFMGTDFKNEISIIRMIKEMVDVSQAINKRIELHNMSHPKAKISSVNPLQFSSLAEVNRVFKTTEGSDPSSSSTPPSTSRAA